MPLKTKLDLPNPEIPGKKLDEKQRKSVLSTLHKLFSNLKRSDVNSNCTNLEKFIGAQPVSFAKEHIDVLMKKDFFVCEKTDGLRLLLLSIMFKNNDDSNKCFPQSFFIDRKNEVYLVSNLFFPNFHSNGTYDYQNYTLLDGELVYQLKTNNNVNDNSNKTMVYLAFDILCYNAEIFIDKNFSIRQGIMRSKVVDQLNYLQYKIYKQYTTLKTSTNQNNKETININDETNKIPHLCLLNVPFRIEAKKMELCYGIQKIIEHDMPNMKHNSDGLIFTSVNDVYLIGTNENMLKWKPPNENSIDFKLKARYEDVNNSSDSSVNTREKPRFGLFMWMGDNKYKYYDDLKVTDEEYKNIFEPRLDILINGKGLIVEVVRTDDGKFWKFYRFREDKQHGNYCEIVHRIEESIKDGVMANELIGLCGEIRQKWKIRHNSNNINFIPNGQSDVNNIQDKDDTYTIEK